MMIKKLLLFTIALICIIASGVLTSRAWNEYQSVLSVLPPGSTIAGIPVDRLSRQEAGVRLVQSYLLTPIRANYNGVSFDLDPQKAGFKLDLEGMLAEAGASSKIGFWEYLINQRPQPVSVALKASLDEAQLKSYLETEIAPAFTILPTQAYVLPDHMNFQPGQAGEELDVDAAIRQVSKAFYSTNQRFVDLTSRPLAAQHPSFDLLDPMLSANIQTSGFQGIIEVYLQDLQTGREIDLAYHQGRPVPPGIAFTAASTIKIPVMVSAFRKTSELTDEVRKQMELMIDLSDNGSTDQVMQMTIDENLAPLQVTSDMRQLGFENTFLAGMFYQGAPLLDRFNTPANQRSDLTTEPDIYNQTTPSEMGRLLADIQQCASQQTGPLIDVFKGEVTPAECQVMIDMLKNNRKAVLIEAGLPEGTALAHKYGWVTDPADGLMHNVSDAAIVYTPGGNFVLSIYVYDSEQLLWDSAQALAARLAIIVSNYYNFNVSPGH